MKLKDINIHFFFLNLIMNFKKELSPSEPLLYSTQLPIPGLLYSGGLQFILLCLDQLCHISSQSISLYNKNSEIFLPFGILRFSYNPPRNSPISQIHLRISVTQLLYNISRQRVKIFSEGAFISLYIAFALFSKKKLVNILATKVRKLKKKYVFED